MLWMKELEEISLHSLEKRLIAEKKAEFRMRLHVFFIETNGFLISKITQLLGNTLEGFICYKLHETLSIFGGILDFSLNDIFVFLIVEPESEHFYLIHFAKLHELLLCETK